MEIILTIYLYSPNCETFKSLVITKFNIKEIAILQKFENNNNEYCLEVLFLHKRFIYSINFFINYLLRKFIFNNVSGIFRKIFA